MGYRSEVRCVIWGAPEKMGAFLVEHRMINPHPAFEHFKKSLQCYIVKYQNYYNKETGISSNQTLQFLDLYDDWVKWSESYSDVISWHNLMDLAEKAGLDYKFIRIGEGDGDTLDVETLTTTHDYDFLGVSQPAIYSDIPEPTKTIDF